ncbi:uncharacterized protein LOC134274584, partial [Saccostrea cucullata]|uniref:uncharacterized protein LOC134274584 n=1 Tax=Saccostrea cuccullata TaxID=36930 RepID=UPI002ED38D1A
MDSIYSVYEDIKRNKVHTVRAPLYRTKIYLGDQYDRWMGKKEELEETHAGLAKILLDRLSSDTNSETESAPYWLKENVSSTPVRKLKAQSLDIPPPDVSEISSTQSEYTDTDEAPAFKKPAM